ncbi:MAG TPA: ribosomal protein L16, partial [Steroidobacteraceae bacterium]|nr:ribosomal protein L16 [Steroidobacteraceae bacterium]
MMQPKRTRFRKQFKGNLKGSSHRGSSVAFGDYALKATDRSRMTAREIE